MEETIFKYVSGTFGVSSAFAMAVMLLALWLTHYVTKKVTEIEKGPSVLEKNSKQLLGDIREIRRDLSFLKD